MTAAFPIVGGAALGLLVGSFLATLVIRWPAGRRIASGRSRCDGCAVPLGPRDLVPLLSYAAARGRCRHCAIRIDPVHPAIEAMAAAIGALACWAQPGWAGIAGALFGWTLLALAALDLRHFWLPDALTLPLLGGGLVAGLAGLPPALMTRAAGAAAGFAALWLVRSAYRRLRGRDGLGGGDAKLLAAIGAWLGWAWLPWVVFGAAAAGCVWVAARAGSGRPVAATDRLPFGTLLAAAAFALWLVATWHGSVI